MLLVPSVWHKADWALLLPGNPGWLVTTGQSVAY